MLACWARAAYRKLAGKELAEDATFELERKRNRPEKYDRQVVAKTIQAMQRIDEIRTRRQERFYEKRMKVHEAHLRRWLHAPPGGGRLGAGVPACAGGLACGGGGPAAAPSSRSGVQRTLAPQCVRVVLTVLLLDVQSNKAKQVEADKLQLEKEIHLVKAPAALTAHKEKLRVAAEQRAAEAMQE